MLARGVVAQVLLDLLQRQAPAAPLSLPVGEAQPEAVQGVQHLQPALRALGLGASNQVLAVVPGIGMDAQADLERSVLDGDAQVEVLVGLVEVLGEVRAEHALELGLGRLRTDEVGPQAAHPIAVELVRVVDARPRLERQVGGLRALRDLLRHGQEATPGPQPVVVVLGAAAAPFGEGLEVPGLEGPQGGGGGFVLGGARGFGGLAGILGGEPSPRAPGSRAARIPRARAPPGPHEARPLRVRPGERSPG